MIDHATIERKAFLQSLREGVSALDLNEHHVLSRHYRTEDNPAHTYREGSYILKKWMEDRKKPR